MPAVAEPSGVQRVTLTLNGQEIKALPGQTILEVARATGVDIPTFCHDPRLEPYGACRMCLVEVEGARGPMAACGTTVREGMKVETHSEKIRKLRKFILELLLTNHPLDCPVCEAAGDCRLQDYAYEYVVDMVPWGWRPPQFTTSGDHPNVAHYGARCILCGRCVRICREIMSIGCWGYVDRGYDTEVDTPYRVPLEEVGCVSCGQCVSTCPVGSIVGRRTPFGAREWQTAKTRTTCAYCANGCELLVYSYRDKVARVASETERGLNGGNLCVKGRFGIGYVNAADRLTTPLVKNASGELEPASWDEALRRIAERAGSIKERQGGGAMAVICGTHCTNEAAYLVQKFARTVLGSHSVDAADRFEQSATEVSLTAAFGGAAATNSRRDIGAAEVILVIGSNLTASNPVLALDVIKALRGGKTVIVVDPRTTGLARRAKMHLAVKPGTDIALLRGLMSHIIALGLEDGVFISTQTEGFAALRESLRDVDIEREAAVCRVSPDMLRAAAEAYGRAGSAAILYGTGVAQGAGSVEMVRAIADLALLTGNVGRPGTGVYPLRVRANSQGLLDMGVRPDRLPGGFGLGEPSAVARAEAAWGGPIDQLPAGRDLARILDGVDSGEVRFLYIVGDDPALAIPDETAVRESLGKVEFLVVQDSFVSDTAKYADVVLPASVASEDEGTFTNSERFVQRVRHAAPSQGESRPDWSIVQSLANTMGSDWVYAGPADVMREISEVVPSYGGISYGRLDEGGLQWPCPRADHLGTAILYTDGFSAGKAAFETVAAGAAGTAPREDFPLSLVTGSVREHHGTGVRSRRSPGLTSLVLEPRLQISPEDADRLGVLDGMRVRVTSPTGSIELAAWLTDRVPRGVVFAPGFSPEAPITRLQQRNATAVPGVRVEPIV